MEYIHPGEEEFSEEPQEIKEIPKYGANVKVENFWGRHAQKQSGEVLNQAGDGLSLSSISDRGVLTSQEIGTSIEASKDGAKAYTSTSVRTQETAENILEGYQKTNPDAPIRKLMISESLTASFPSEFLSLYESEYLESRRRVMEEMGLSIEIFGSLDENQQEEISEKAEEPLIRAWLSGESKLAELFPPQEASKHFAKLFDRHNRRILSKLFSGSEVDLIHISHKGIMEPFLVSGVLIDSETNKPVLSIEDLGGSLAVSEGWQSTASTDENGNTSIIVKIRNKTYQVDQLKLQELLEESK